MRRIQPAFTSGLSAWCNALAFLPRLVRRLVANSRVKSRARMIYCCTLNSVQTLPEFSCQQRSESNTLWKSCRGRKSGMKSSRCKAYWTRDSQFLQPVYSFGLKGSAHGTLCIPSGQPALTWWGSGEVIWIKRERLGKGLLQGWIEVPLEPSCDLPCPLRPYF